MHNLSLNSPADVPFARIGALGKSTGTGPLWETNGRKPTTGTISLGFQWISSLLNTEISFPLPISVALPHLIVNLQDRTPEPRLVRQFTGSGN